MNNIKFTNKSMLIISILKEDRLHEAFEYALELLKKDIDCGNASKYFLKDFDNNTNLLNFEKIKNCNFVKTTNSITKDEEKHGKNYEIDTKNNIIDTKEFNKIEDVKNTLEKFENIEEIKEEVVLIEVKGFVDLSEF